MEARVGDLFEMLERNGTGDYIGGSRNPVRFMRMNHR